MLLDRRRIMVIGAGGAGKSTFARELALLTGLPLIHLDLHYWKPGWAPTPTAEWNDCVRALTGGDSWIIDGNYGGTLSIRVQRADAIVFFDMPRMVCMRGVLQRWLAHQFKRRADLAEGCPERMNVEFLKWVWNFQRNSRPRLQAALGQAGPHVELVTITRRAQARTILEQIERRAA